MRFHTLFLILFGALLCHQVFSLPLYRSGSLKPKKMSTSMVSESSLSVEPLHAILWDVDGTISDSFMLGFSSTQKVLERNGKGRISEHEYHEGTRLTTPRRLAWHVTGDPDHEIGIELGRQFDELYVDLVSKETAPLYPGMLELLQELSSSKRVLIGALSNACGAYVSAVLRENDLNDIFSIGLGADEVSRAKPHPDGLLHCCKTLNVHPSRCVYIGDSPSDGEAAASAGMISIGVTWGSHPSEKVRKAFTRSVDTVEQLKSILLASI